MTNKLIGTAPNQIPTNADLSDTAFQNSNNANLTGIATFDRLTSASTDIVATTKPNIEPTLLLDFANSETVDSRITFTRESIATRVNRFGKIETVDWNVPRINYDPVTGECLGFLIEEARTNVLMNSNAFSDSVWTTSNLAVEPNSTTAPDGTLTSAKIIASNTSSSHYIRQIFSATSGNYYTVAIYAKAGELSIVELAFSTYANWENSIPWAKFDLTTGIATTTNPAAIVQMSPCMNGWYRCSMTVKAIATFTSTFTLLLCNSTGSDTFTGDGSSGVYIWGAQVEVGSFPTSYIPTNATAVTRDVDIPRISLSSQNFVSEGTVYSHFNTQATTKFAVVYLGPESNGTPHICASTDAPGVLYGSIYGLSTSGRTYGTSSFPNEVKVAYGYKSGDTAISTNGSLVTSSYVFTISPANGAAGTTGTIGYTTLTSLVGSLNGHMKKLMYYPKRVSNTELQGLTRI